MTLKIKEELKMLIKNIKLHDKLYHHEDNPFITDDEYDKICLKYDELVNLYPDLGFTPRKQIGFKPKRQFSKLKHQKPMLSLNNGFSLDDIENFISKSKKFLSLKSDDDLEFVCEPKIDGLSISLIYENGQLKSALTRGDGIFGELVTENILTIKKIPKSIKNPPKFIEIRGEIFMFKNDFNNLNLKQIENRLKVFSNPRNAAAGSIRQKNVAITKERKLNFVAYTIGDVSDELKIKSQSELLKFLKSWNFKIPENVNCIKNIFEIKQYYQMMLNKRNNLNFEIDGLVYKVNSFEFQKRLGFISRAPRWAIAHKLPSNLVETIIENIDVQVGRTGALTPVARLRKTNVGGVFVSNVSLHNEDEIERKDIRIGDSVLIERAGDVIPHIKKVIIEKRKLGSLKYQMPDYCPSCNTKTFKKENEAVRRCINGVNCQSQAIEKLIHFCSKNAFDIDGLGERQIKLFYKQNFIKKFSDIFFLNSFKSKLIKLDGFGELSLENLFKSIENSKSISFEKFLFSLGIKQVGESTAKLLAENYIDFENLKSELAKAINKNSNSYLNLINIDQIGESIVDDLISFFENQSNSNEITKLLDIIKIQNKKDKKNNSFFSNKKIVVTGTLKSLSREEVKSILIKNGAKVISQISNNTDYLIYGEKPGKKISLAKEKKIQILTENDFINLIEKKL